MEQQIRAIEAPIQARYADEIALDPEVVDEILRTGSNRSKGQLRLIYNFMVEKTPEEYTEFVKNEYGTGGKGFEIDGAKYAVRFDDLGLRIAAGDTAKGGTIVNKGRILIPFNNLINDTYCRDISLRVRSHLDVKRKEGQFIGSFAGYGYRKDPKDKNHLIIDEYAAGIVQEIFKQKLNGMSSQRIASHLNELGVLPPNEYKRANGFNYTCGFQAGLNQKWTVVSVNRILKNESYTGTLIQGKRRKINYKVKKSHDVGSENWIRVEDAHDAIISKGEFQQVQQLLELDTRTAPSQTTVYPLSGFLRCADCGQNMIRRTVTKNGKKYQYYHCSTYKNGGGCTPHMINSEKLTESVLAAIRHQVTLLVEAEKVLSNAELASGEQIGIKILDSQITALEAELERYSNLKIRLYQDLCDDVVSREEYGEMNTRFAQKIKEAQDKIQEIREKKQEALKHDTLLPTWLEEFKQYEHIKTLERRVVVELIDHIDVHSKTEIEIHFCFEDELHSITEKFMEYAKQKNLLMGSNPIIAPDSEMLWNAAIVWRILRRYEYTGALVMGRRKKIDVNTTSVRTLPEDKWIIAENAHAAIVTKDEYYQAQKAIRNVTPIQYKVGDDFALKGKICCGNCNRQLRHERQYGEMVFYCGYKRSAGKFSKCYGGYYREYSVNAKVARAIKTVFYALDVVNQGMQEKQSITVRCMDIEDLEKQAEAIRVEQIKLYESYADGVLRRDAYIEKKKALSEKLAALQDSIRTEKEEQECADELDEEIRALTKQASEKTYIGGLTKECVDAFVSMVYLYDDQTMKIEFNCEDVIRRALEKYGA